MFAHISSRFLIFIVSALAIAVPIATAASVRAQEPQPPTAPTKLTHSVEPGTTTVTVNWAAVPGATSYRVRWRLKPGDFAANSQATVSSPTAAIDVSKQGLWLIKVQACNADGCGKPARSLVKVIINITGHEAVRGWIDASGWHLDWDPLPGKYVVKYSINNDGWYTSPPQSKVGYTFPASKSHSTAPRVTITSLKIRVYFNCDEAGKNCSLLGRLPNTRVYDVPPDPVPSWEYYAAISGAAGDAPRREGDPLTGRLRTDLTVTYETWDDGLTYRCVSRPAENPWEKGVYGDPVKSCYHGETIDQYKLDFDAVFPGGARCIERAPESEQERWEFGETVRVCNDFDPMDQPRHAHDEGVSGQTHRNSHIPNTERISPAHHLIQPYGRIHTCESEKFRHPTTFHGDTVHVWITARRCYDWGNRVERVRTIASTSGATMPGAGVPFRFCGWERGESPRNPYEVVWRYTHPQGLNPVLHWEYGSRITAVYGARAVPVDAMNSMGMLLIGEVGECLLPSIFRHFTAEAAIIADNRGGHRRWR